MSPPESATYLPLDQGFPVAVPADVAVPVDGSGQGGVGHGVVVRSAWSADPVGEDAVTAVAEELGDDAGLVLAFVSGGYDLDRVAGALTSWAGDRVIACTSAGALSRAGFQRSGIVVVALPGPDLEAVTIPIRPLAELDEVWAQAGGALRQAIRGTGVQADGRSQFAVMLVDGLSRREELLAEQVSGLLGGVPLIGGSAGDDLRFERTAVLVDGRFVSGAATVTVVTTGTPFRRFRVQHHAAGDQVLVVTSATAHERLVHTLNGRCAAEEYARAVGVGPADLSPTVFSTHPLVLRAGGGNWIRSISRVEPDGSLRFLCVAETGTVLRLGCSQDPATALADQFTSLRSELGPLAGVLAFDCILRRLEFEEGGLDRELGHLLAREGVVGFSTYGEQYDGVHVNQTMVGIAFGR